VDVTARQPWLTAVRGRLTAGSGRLVVQQDLLDSWVRVDLVAGSLSTGLGPRDAALKGPDVLDAESHPWIRFESTLVSPHDDGRFLAEADLYVRDHVVPVVAQIRPVDVTPDRIRVAVTATLSWRALGLGWGSTIERMGMLGDRISVVVAAEFRS